MASQIEMSEFILPNWECKFDARLGKSYYVNHLTKTTTWEDPRIRYKQIYDVIPTQETSQQPVHAGSPYHVYPAKNYPQVQAAFQGPSSLSASPQLAAKLQQLEMSPVSRASTNTVRSVSNLAKQSVQETSFSTAAETENSVSKINSMFPTVPETHIRMLLKKYLKGIFPKAEEVLILDVLANADNNVQKASENLIAIGYEKKDTPGQKISLRKTEEEKSKKREMEKQAAQPPKLKTTEEKNKMKVRLQNHYKSVAERIISMALESVEYSEDKACQILNIVMQEDDNLLKALQQENGGSTSRSQSNSRSPSKLQSQQKHLQQQQQLQQQKNQQTYSVVMKTVQQNLSPADKDGHIISPTNGIRFKQSRPKAKNDHSKYSNSRISPETDAKKKADFKSMLERTNTNGPNTEIINGPNDDLLLVDYVTWRGANSDLAHGRRGLSCGSDPSLRTERSYSPLGAKKDIYTGVNMGLAKGSIYSQINRGMADVKVN